MKTATRTKFGAIAAVTALLFTGMQSASAVEQGRVSSENQIGTKSVIQMLQAVEPTGPPEGATILEAPAEYQALLDSGAPLEISVNGATGEIVAIEETSTVSALGDASVTKNTCPSITPCWTGYTPYASYGFYGTGTVYGTWPARLDFRSNFREAQICWTAPTFTPGAQMCSWRLGQHAIWNFADSTGTGKSVTLF